MAFEYWFVSRPKRQLTSILNSLIAFSDTCIGKIWSGNHELQLSFEDELGNRNITQHGNLRARRTSQGGGGARTMFKQMKDLGLIFTEDENGFCRLTLIGEKLIRGEISLVEAMRLQLHRYQYPSATSWSGSGAVDRSFKIHPFQFMFRLLLDSRLKNYLTMEEMSGIIIHRAKSDDSLQDVIERILRYRNDRYSEFVPDTQTQTFNNVANTFFNYIDLTQYVDRGQKIIGIKSNKRDRVEEFIEENPKFIPHPEFQEIYQRYYGRGNSAKDLRNFNSTRQISKRELIELKIQREYILLTLKTPISKITPSIVQTISEKTGIDEKFIEKFLRKNYSGGAVDDFFAMYRELARMGTSGARDFEKATCEIFQKIFGMNARHVGAIGNTPDVFVESEKYCGIIDNKAYRNGYSISGNHSRVMIDVYIPNYRKYGETSLPLEFFMYIADSFGKNINSQIQKIHRDTGVNGSAISVEVLIELAQNYSKLNFDHEILRRLFSLNREIQLSDLDLIHE